MWTCQSSLEKRWDWLGSWTVPEHMEAYSGRFKQRGGRDLCFSSSGFHGTDIWAKVFVDLWALEAMWPSGRPWGPHMESGSGGWQHGPWVQTPKRSLRPDSDGEGS